ncbi:uncharacterized protein LOC122509729 [Leptopilina heterotoma]|uniref:uncharacterized protein LOC122509729 n=1 Tax=Leptopilina heterotoma TaxID=63436 RepID=UPI001CA95856|nr:uncharacterized protein LOC122509729 [Leptopilina heterotoma]
MYCSDYEILKTILPVDTSIGNDLSSLSNPNNRLNDLIHESNAISIFTDGSKVSSRSYVGSACICPELSICIRKSMPCEASVFTAECVALSDALDVALEHRSHSFLIFSDSLSALQSLKSSFLTIKTNPYIFEIKEKYVKFFANNSYNSFITFFWVPSHNGVRGNEEADFQAKSATEKDFLDILRIPYTDLYELFKKKSFSLSTDIILEQGLVKELTITIWLNLWPV